MNFIEKMKQAIRKAFGEEKKPSEIKTDEEKVKLAQTYKEMWETDLDKDFQEYQQTKQKAQAYDSAISLVSSQEEPEEGTDPDQQAEGNTGQSAQAGAQGQEPGDSAEPAGQSQEPGRTVDLNARIEQIQNENKQLKDKVSKLEKEPEGDNPKQEKVSISVQGLNHTESHLFGVEHSLFSREKRWNEIMANPRVAKVSDPDEENDFAALQNEVKSYGAGIARRMQQLHNQGQLNLTPKGALNVDYSDLTNADLGDQFVVRRQDALIARIMQLPSVTDVFPRRFGVQDKELITNAFLGEFSQPYQSGEVWKGGMELQPEMGHVDDAMFKTLFESMKWLERTYLGYLNQEGSDPVKWTMIEWVILQIAKKLTKEQNKRRIMGIYAKPESGRAYNALHGSTGVIYTLLRYMNQFKLNPFDDAGLSSYDNANTNMVDAVIAFKDKLRETVEDFDESEFEMILNANHRHWFKDQFRSKYGTDNDFTSIQDEVVPDSEMPIRWVRGMGNLTWIIVQQPGNIQLLENLPGEMFNIKFQQDMENVKAWSVWKEGVAAAFVGKKFNSKSALDANGYEDQVIFTNKPVKEIAADETTPDVSDNFWLKTQDNTQATAITDLQNKKAGKAYMIEIGGTDNATTVAKSGLFDQITEAFNPTAVGDYLMVIWDPEADSGSGKFYELERMVGGTRTVNTAKQPNLPSA